MLKPTPNATARTAMRTTLATIALVLGSAAFAQWGTPASSTTMDAAWWAEYNAVTEALQRETMAPFVRYYREMTGDHQTPDALAGQYGINLYCQNNPAECAAIDASYAAADAQNHAARMRDIQSWGAVSSGIAASNSSILDSSHQGFLDRSAAQSEGHANYVQGAIQGESTFVDPSTGVGWSLPVMPDPNTQYWTPDGQPLAFDFQMGVWYVGSAWGWSPLQAQR